MDTQNNSSTTNYVRTDLQNASQAANLHLNEQVRQMKEKGVEVYHLAFGQSPFPIPKCFVDGLTKYADSHEYLSVSGTEKLCKAISEFHKRFQDVEFEPDNIIVGCGSKELIFLAMLVFNGDIILISPGWTTYAPQVKLSGKSPIATIQTSASTDWKITPKILESTLQSINSSSNKLIIFNNPGNPSGTAYTKDELCALSEIFRKHKMIVLSDEIYGQLTYSGHHVPLSKLYPEGTLTTTGFSKWSSAGGWRIGYMNVPSQQIPLLKALKAARTHTFTCAPAPMQHALSQGLYNYDELDRYMGLSRYILSQAGQYCVRTLNKAGVTSAPSEAGYYIFPDFEVCRNALIQKGIKSGHEMCKEIMDKKNVALLPGSDFLHGDNDLTVRLCFVEFDGKAIMEALTDDIQTYRNVEVTSEDNDNFVKKFMPRIVNAINKLCEFVQENV